MSDLFAITDEDKMRCIEREIKMRLWVYKKRVDLGQMTAEKAQREIDIMKAIAIDYRRKVYGTAAGNPASERDAGGLREDPSPDRNAKADGSLE